MKPEPESSTQHSALSTQRLEGGPLHKAILVVGGGLAGLAATVALAQQGYQVTLLEARQRLGGRAGSFTDASSGQLVDACQHVSMGCCTYLREFFKTVGIDHLLKPQPCLYFMTADRRISRLAAAPWPAPWHLARSFLGLHFLTPGEKLRIAWGLDRLQRANAQDDPPFQTWLEQHHQSPRTIERFWGLVLTSALNETPERIGLRYARKVFVDGFLTHRGGFEIEIPGVPLGRLYGAELQEWLKSHGVQLRLGNAARSLKIKGNYVRGIELRTGEVLTADSYLLAVPFDRVLDLLPPEVVDAQPYFNNLRQLQTSPITSIHIWLDRPLLRIPHVVLVGCLGQWVFNRGEVAPAEYYVQIVVSAARQFRELGHEEVQRRIAAELRDLFPEMNQAIIHRTRVLTEHAATFSVVPGVDQWRPPQQSPLANLTIAGDWTATGWPATMEGAVRSGYLAAEVVLHQHKMSATIIQRPVEQDCD